MVIFRREHEMAAYSCQKLFRYGGRLQQRREDYGLSRLPRFVFGSK